MIDRIVVWALTLRVRARSERGQDVMEYAILTGGIALVIAAVLLVTPIRDSIENFATTVGNCLDLGSGYSCP